MTLSINTVAQKLLSPLFALCLIATATTASAQSAGSWIDLAGGNARAGASANGSLLQFAKSKSSSKNGVDFGHGFAVGASETGISISNTIGAGHRGNGVAHNLNMHIGANGTHVSHGGVHTQGGNRRVISGGQTGVRNGQVYGGSSSTGFGHQTNAWSNSRTRQWSQGHYQPVQQYQPQAQQFVPQPQVFQRPAFGRPPMVRPGIQAFRRF